MGDYAFFQGFFEKLSDVLSCHPVEFFDLHFTAYFTKLHMLSMEKSKLVKSIFKSGARGLKFRDCHVDFLCHVHS